MPMAYTLERGEGRRSSSSSSLLYERVVKISSGIYEISLEIFLYHFHVL
jgi:hypothetical protein